MKQAKFYLEKRKDEKGNVINLNVPIRMSFFFDGERLEYYTAVRIQNIKNFNDKYLTNGKSIIKANEPEASRMNQRLKEMKAKAESLYDDARPLGIKPTPEYLTKKLDEVFKPKKVRSSHVLTVQNAFLEFLDFTKAKKSLPTWKKMNTTYNHLADACTATAEDGKRFIKKTFNKITFDQIDPVFIEGYRKYLCTGDALNNTVVKYLRAFSEFLNWCKDDKRKYYNGNTKFEDLKENQINVIYLNTKELQILSETAMPNETLERVKDVFLFGCYTGLRHSDLHKLKKKDVRMEDEEIRFYITKGKKTTWQDVPLITQAKLIIKKYEMLESEKALPVLSNQKMNQYLKEVMKFAKFNEVVTISEMLGTGEIEEKEYSKWELITCHTSRKSFISFAVEKGMPEIVIKSITGHSKNSRAFSRYYEVSSENKKKEMRRVFGALDKGKIYAIKS